MTHTVTSDSTGRLSYTGEVMIEVASHDHSQPLNRVTSEYLFDSGGEQVRIHGRLLRCPDCGHSTRTVHDHWAMRDHCIECGFEHDHDYSIGSARDALTYTYEGNVVGRL